MKKNRMCKYCDKIFEDIEGRIFSNHVRWCNKNTTNGDKGINSISKSALSYYSIKKGNKKEFGVHCFRCTTPYFVTERESEFPKKDKYFCSRSCANANPMTESRRANISMTCKSSLKVLTANKLRIKNLIVQCIVCTKDCKRGYTKFCSVRCKKEYGIKTKPYKIKYKSLSNFKFSLNNYPDSFDFELINKHGWYKAKNRGDNPDGISRDHLISVHKGISDNINPLILAHPANCQLLTGRNNSRKHINCGLTINELLDKIKKWDDEYGNFYKNKIETFILPDEIDKLYQMLS